MMADRSIELKFKAHSIEKLTALCALWVFGLGSKEDYCAVLDEMFLEDPEDDFLLELENCTGDAAASLARLSPFMNGEFDVDAFGRELFSRLEIFCDSGAVSMKEFGRRCYELWRQLPWDLNLDEPFYTLCWADEFYYEGSKIQRGYYQNAFDYYKEKQ